MWGTVSNELYGGGDGGVRVILTEQIFMAIEQVMSVAFWRTVPQFRVIYEIEKTHIFLLTPRNKWNYPACLTPLGPQVSEDS